MPCVQTSSGTRHSVFVSSINARARTGCCDSDSNSATEYLRKIVKDCIDEVIKIILEKYEGEADKEGGEYVAKCWHIVKNNLR